jgi:bacterioferritin (cytochrome b1)
MNSLGERILVMQGNGNYEAAKTMVEEKGTIRDQLQQDLNRLSEEGIPRDIRFEQGKQVLGL